MPNAMRNIGVELRPKLTSGNGSLGTGIASDRARLGEEVRVETTFFRKAVSTLTAICA